PEVMDLLRAHSWPGNLRELQSVLKQSLLKAVGTVLLPAFVPPLGPADVPPPPPAEFPDLQHFFEQRLHNGSTDLHAESITMLERQLVTRVLRHTGGNQVQAARILGITRGSLRTKIRALGILIERTIASEDDGDDF